MCRSPIRIDGWKSRIRPAPGNGFKFSESMRDRIWTLFLDEDASGNASENSWMLKPMTPIQKVGSKILLPKTATRARTVRYLFARRRRRSRSASSRSCGARHRAIYRSEAAACFTRWQVTAVRGERRRGTYRNIRTFDIEGRVVLPDALPRGYLRGFAFARDSKSFYYVHESSRTKRPHSRAAFHHVLGTSFDDDKEIFSPGEDAQTVVSRSFR